MENAFAIAVTNGIEEFYVHARDHRANRCNCDTLRIEAEQLRPALEEALAQVQDVLHTPRRARSRSHLSLKS